ncbi:MAG: GNAT family N-acetyltransferase [archaeon]
MVKQKLKLVKARLGDFEAIAKIYSEEFSKPPYNEPWTYKIAKKRVKDYSRYCDIWKLILEKEVIGFFFVTTSRWYPGYAIFGEEAAIKKEFQGKGYGKFMINEIKKTYRKQGFKYIEALSNRKSEAFKIWKKLGAKIDKDAQILRWRLK